METSVISTSLSESDILKMVNRQRSSRKPQETQGATLEPSSPAKVYTHKYVWRNIFGMALLHAGAVYGMFMVPRAQMPSIAYVWLLAVLSTLGVQAGAHRLWCHRSYKANFGLRLFLSLCHVLAMQNDLYEWCRDHRTHHRFSDTDADPHNSTRGFFFSHMGWLLVKKHPDVIRKGRTINMDDLKADPIVMFQRQFYIPLVILFWGLIPSSIPWYFWGEPFIECFFGCVMSRYVITLHLTWLVNSWSHLYGTRPYDSQIAPVESSIRHLLMGEGFHNYHHAFPWDYSASELGPLDVFNPVTAMINLFAYFGWAWDLRKVAPSVVAKKAQSTGVPSLTNRKGHALWEWSTGMVALFFIYLIFVTLNIVFKSDCHQTGNCAIFLT